jgi:hypothetical protein
MMTLGDLLDVVPSPAISLDAFGAQQEPVTGSLRSGVAPRMLREIVAGQFGHGYSAASTFDLKLRVAELMAELNLPGVLAPSLIGKVTTQILLDTTLGAPFDWLVVLRRISDYSPAEVSNLMAALTADGTLVAAEP